jgi:nitrogen regulatory protein PII
MDKEMKLVMITYNEAIDQEVMEILENCAVKNYTKATGVFGKGTTSGTHMGDDIWPGRNNILYVACEEDRAWQILDCVKELRKSLGREGVKAFILGVEEIT